MEEDIAILRVDTTVDENDGSATEGEGLSLRDAVLIANSTPEDEIIELESGQTYQLTIEGVDPESIFVDEDSATQGDLDIGSTGGKLTIRGLGDEGATIDGNQINRVIQVRDDFNENAATLVLENMTITGGQAITEDITDDGGGGIYVDNRATAEIINSRIIGNTVSFTNQSGGGIFNDGTLIVRNSIIENNTAGNGGGVHTSYGVTEIFDSTITNNSVSRISSGTEISSGGGINHEGTGTTEINNSTITNNTAGFFGGGVAGDEFSGSKGSVRIVDSTITGNTANTGGGVGSNGVETMTIENTTIENNTANRGGGGVGILNILDEVTITGSNIRNNNAATDGGGIDSGGTLFLRESTVSGNSAEGDGGGVSSSLSTAVISDSVIDNNSAGDTGGGLRDVESIRNTTVSNNKSVGSGGGMFTLAPGIIINSTFSNNESESFGGGLSVLGNPTGSAVAIANSTISGNKAQDSGGGISIGGSLIVDTPENYGVDYTSEVINIAGDVFATNVTITGNVADSDNDGTGDGGGIQNAPTFITGNEDPTQGVRNRFGSGKIILANSILASNFDNPDNNGEGTINRNISGAAGGNANNLVGNLTGLTIESVLVAPEEESLGQGSDLTGIDPQIGQLQDNGGVTPTHALLAGSPAINAGNNESILQETFIDINNDDEPTTIDFNNDGDFNDAIPFDQRGGDFNRIFGETVDIGAFEVQEELPLPEDNPPTVVTPIEDISFTETGEDRTIDLSNVFNDADDDEIAIAVASNSNNELVTASIEENNLVLDFAEDTNGTADITLRATANGQTVDDTFTVTVEADEETPEQTIELFRFRNTTFDTGTYIFVGEAERDFILDDENLSNTFALDGIDEDGTVNPAFTASEVDGDGLIPFYRLESLTVEGTFLFVSTAEYEFIFDDPVQSQQWKKQGFADEDETQDIPEFYLYEGSADSGTEFNRFQNQQNGTFLYAGGGEIDGIEDNPDLANLFDNQGVAFKSL